jgi:Mn2+/Fe2+ NRAMP family transporter
MISIKNIWQILGPGILYAAAAIGVSHLVQATRAGADYGLGLMFIVLFACAIKYPSLRFGGDYTAATGESLILNYKRQGWWLFCIYAIAELFSMVFIIAAVSLFTLGLLKVVLGFDVSNVLGVSVLLSVAIILLLTGKYHLLEGTTKYLVIILVVMVFVATILVIPQVEWSLEAFIPPKFNEASIIYLIALIGFMPSPANGSVMQSLWTCARAEADGYLPKREDSRLDFNVGYSISVILGLCFLLLGAGVMHSKGVIVEESNGGFSSQLIQLFTETIGGWSFYLISIVAVIIMLSTLLAVVDGMARIFGGLVYAAKGDNKYRPLKQKSYTISMILICCAAVLVISTMMKSFSTFIDMVAIVLFVISPIVAFMSHRAVTGTSMPEEAKPGGILRAWSLISFFLLLILTLLYLYFRFYI